MCWISTVSAEAVAVGVFSKRMVYNKSWSGNPCRSAKAQRALDGVGVVGGELVDALMLLMQERGRAPDVILLKRPRIIPVRDIVGNWIENLFQRHRRLTRQRARPRATVRTWPRQETFAQTPQPCLKSSDLPACFDRRSTLSTVNSTSRPCAACPVPSAKFPSTRARLPNSTPSRASSPARLKI